MWGIFSCGILAIAGIQAQPIQNLLLPRAAHIFGSVVDVEGKPVAGRVLNTPMITCKTTKRIRRAGLNWIPGRLFL
jgi:hypothetical protein